VTAVLTDRTPPVTVFARAVEERGLHAMWLPDHTHIPVARRSPYPLGGALPEAYTRLLDPLVALAMAAAVTDRIRLGTGILLAAQRDPIVTAKALATLDQQSGGRLRVGVGFGWNIEEAANHGVPAAHRRPRTREHVLAMRRLWEDDVAVHARLAPSWSWPKPAQRPLPVLVGGAPTDTVFAHVVEYAQGWIPLGGHGLSSAVRRLHALAERAGRDPATVRVVPFTALPRDESKLDALHRAGATEIAVAVDPNGPDLDHLANLLSR